MDAANFHISSAMSARPGKVKVFQFGGRGITQSTYFAELSDLDSSSMPYDPEVETEFSRLRDDGVSFGVLASGNQDLSGGRKSNYKEREDETLLFYEDFVRMKEGLKLRSKSLDQIDTIVLSEELFKRNTVAEPFLVEDDAKLRATTAEPESAE